MKTLTPMRHEAIPLLAACTIVTRDLHPVTSAHGLEQYRECRCTPAHERAILAMATQLDWTLAGMVPDDPDDALVSDLVTEAKAWTTTHDGVMHQSTEALLDRVEALAFALGSSALAVEEQRDLMLGRLDEPGLPSMALFRGAVL